VSGTARLGEKGELVNIHWDHNVVPIVMGTWLHSFNVLDGEDKGLPADLGLINVDIDKALRQRCVRQEQIQINKTKVSSHICVPRKRNGSPRLS
jgi:hypothetical protein